MTCATTPGVLAFAWNWGLDVVRGEFDRFMSQNEVRIPMQLIGWLRRSCADISRRTTMAAVVINHETSRLTKYAYLSAVLQ